MKYDRTQEPADAAACAAARTPVMPDEVARFRMLLEQAPAALADETPEDGRGDDSGEDEAMQASQADQTLPGSRGKTGAGNGRGDVDGRRQDSSRAALSDPFAFPLCRIGAAVAMEPETRRRPQPVAPDDDAHRQDAVEAGRPAAADMVRDLVAEILFAIELPDRRHALGLEMHSAVLPDTRICLTMNDDELSVLLQTRSEPVYRDALARRGALLHALVRRCARSVVVEIEFDA